MPNEPSTDTSLLPNSDAGREDSGLQDILAVAAKIKDKPAASANDDGDDGDDGGMILFTSGSEGLGGGASDEDDDALFGSFAGGLDLAAPDSLAAEVTAAAAAEAAPPKAVPAKEEEGSNKGLIIVAAVLGFAIVGGGGWFLFGNKAEPQTQQAVAEVAKDSAGAKSEEPAAAIDPDAAAAAAGASAGAAVEPEVVEPEVVEDPLAEADTEGLGGMDDDGSDPMAMREGMFEKKDSPVAKQGKWDKGESAAKPAGDPEPSALPDPPEPEPVVDPLPEPKSGGNNKVTEEDVDCLLNPDLPKCGSDSGPKKPQHEVIAPKLPDKLSSKQLRSGFSSVKPEAKKCGLKHGAPPGTKVKVHVSIEGQSGKVTSAKAVGEHAGSPLGTCVENAAKGAQFDKFKKPAMGIDYPLIM